MRHASLCLGAVLAFVPLTRATAQMAVRPGERVRVTGYFCQPFYNNCIERNVGTFVSLKADTLVVLSSGDTLAVPVDLVTRLDVSRGRKTNRGKGAGIGFILGAVLGSVIGYASYDECVPQGWLGCFMDFGPEASAAGGFAAGSLGGAVVGALIGGLSKTDRWHEVPLDRVRVTFGPQHIGGVGLWASVKF
jgi:hypothetical protein